jgi:cytochrome c oxidase assembly factor CtaG
MVATLASGYHGPPELTPLRALTEWTLDPWALGFIVLLGGLYLAGVRRVRQSQRSPGGTSAAGSGARGTSPAGSWPAGRVVAFCGLGLGFAVLATMSFVGVYQPVLFYVRSVQTILLLLVVPLFLALGRPLSLAIAALPRLGPRLQAGIRSRAAVTLTFPAISTMVLILVPFVLYFSPWYAAGFGSTLVRDLTYLALLVPGFVFFWTLLRVDPVPKAYPYLVALWITGAEVVGDAVLGLAVIVDQNLIAGAYYHVLARPWGPGLAGDQVIGGGALWVLGDLVGLPFLAAQLIQMIREDEAEAAAIDAELDAADAAAAASAAGTSAAGTSAAAVAAAGAGDAAGATAGAGPAGAANRPWWESDPRFANRFRPADDGGE